MNQKGRINVRVLPEPLYLERGNGFQRLSFDLWLENQGEQEFIIRAIELWAYDHEERLLLKRRVDDNGLNPGIETLPERRISPKASLYLFNPLDTFAEGLELTHIRCRIYLVAEEEKGKEETLTINIFPQVYEQKVPLILPLRGRIFMDEGHNYYSHHRRLALNHPVAQQFGITANSGRYSWDFMLVDEGGNPHRSQTQAPTNEDYHGFGAPVLAPADGIVIRARNDVPDNLLNPGEDVEKPRLTLEDFLADPLLMAGNHVVIDHGSGEFSMLGHLQKGSLRVREGKPVKQEEVIGQLGNSGASRYPHLHYQLTNGPDFRTAEGLPCYFLSYRLVTGDREVGIKRGVPEGGEFIRTYGLEEVTDG